MYEQCEASPTTIWLILVRTSTLCASKAIEDKCLMLKNQGLRHFKRQPLPQPQQAKDHPEIKELSAP